MVLTVSEVADNIDTFLGRNITVQGVIFIKGRSINIPYEDITFKKLNPATKYASILPDYFTWFHLAKDNRIFLIPFDGDASLDEPPSILLNLSMDKDFGISLLHALPLWLSRLLIKGICPTPIVKIDYSRLADTFRRSTLKMHIEVYPWKEVVQINGRVSKSTNPEFAFLMDNIKSVHVKAENSSSHEDVFFEFSQ